MDSAINRWTKYIQIVHAHKWETGWIGKDDSIINIKYIDLRYPKRWYPTMHRGSLPPPGSCCPRRRPRRRRGGCCAWASWGTSSSMCGKFPVTTSSYTSIHTDDTVKYCVLDSWTDRETHAMKLSLTCSHQARLNTFTFRQLKTHSRILSIQIIMKTPYDVLKSSITNWTEQL